MHTSSSILYLGLDHKSLHTVGVGNTLIEKFLKGSILSGSLFPDATAFVPTVTDNAFRQGLIGSRSIGISFAPTTSLDGDTNGEISFGGVDDSKYIGQLNYV